MIPQRRFATLLHQAEEFQRQQCIYHNPPPNSRFSLYSDHRCSKNDFPRITTTILEVHADEVWNIEWSHDGNYLASASKDKTAIIWRRGVGFSSCIHTAVNSSYSLILRHLRNGRPILFFVTINTLWDVWLGRRMTRCCLRVQNTLSRCGTQEWVMSPMVSLYDSARNCRRAFVSEPSTIIQRLWQLFHGYQMAQVSYLED